MPGFGSGKFGSGSFGRFDWSKQVMFNDLPPEDRALDALEQNGRLERFIDALRPSADELRGHLDDYTSLRDASRVRVAESVSATISSTVALTQTTQVFLADPDPSDTFNPLGIVSVGWTLRDANGTPFEINSVHKLDSAGPMVEIKGRVAPVAGACALERPTLIDLLGNDYGVHVDDHESEAFQRSSVENAYQWYATKGAATSYEVVGRISGYRVTATPMWGLSPVPPSFPAANLFEIPLGSGVFYTDLAGARPIFDEVVADVVPTDMYCFESVGGVPVPDAIADGLESLSVVTAIDLGGGKWNVLISGPLERIGSFEHWSMELLTGTTGSFPLEGPPVLSGSLWYVPVYLGPSPSLGAKAKFTYNCHPLSECGYCAASVIKVDIVPDEVLTDPTISLEEAIPRILEKLQRAVPVHIRQADFVHVIGPTSATMVFAAAATSSSAVSVSAALGYYFDRTPADVVPVDPPHMAVTSVTTFTVP